MNLFEAVAKVASEVGQAPNKIEIPIYLRKIHQKLPFAVRAETPNASRSIATVDSTPAGAMPFYSPMILTNTRLRRRPSNSP